MWPLRGLERFYHLGCYPARGSGLFVYHGKEEEMSKQFGSIDKLLKSKHRRERERVRADQMAQAEAHRQFRRELQAIKDKMDLFGEDALDQEERALVSSRPAFFFPESVT